MAPCKRGHYNDRVKIRQKSILFYILAFAGYDANNDNLRKEVRYLATEEFQVVRKVLNARLRLTYKVVRPTAAKPPAVDPMTIPAMEPPLSPPEDWCILDDAGWLC